jgi:hypothetical protein
VPGLRQQLLEATESLRAAQHELEDQQQHKAEADRLQQEVDLWKAAFKVPMGCPLLLCGTLQKQQSPCIIDSHAGVQDSKTYIRF